MNKSQDEIEFTFSLNIGQEGVDDDENNCLARAFKDLLLEGKPYNSHSLCYFSAAGKDGGIVPRWLGVLLLSRGKRILFFPGITRPGNIVNTTHKGRVDTSRNFIIDHLSLEIETGKWHFTSKTPSKHKAGGKIAKVDQDYRLWFGLSVANDEVLRKVRRDTLVRFPSPSSDSRRRMSIATQLHQNAAQNLVSSLSESKKKYSNGFHHFTFIVAPIGSKPYSGGQLLPPHDHPGVSPLPAIAKKNIPIRTHKVPLSTELEIQIVVTGFPGEIPSPFIYSTRA